MNSNSKLLLIAVPLLIAGCAAYEMPPLAVNHPARADVMGAPARSPSRTLAYTQADVPSTRPVLAAAQQGGHDAHHPGNAGAPKTVVGEGKVIATVPNANQVVVEHGEIKGFMEAMTMGYRVDPPSLLEGMKSGDKVRFTIDVSKKAIIKIKN